MALKKIASMAVLGFRTDMGKNETTTRNYPKFWSFYSVYCTNMIIIVYLAPLNITTSNIPQHIHRFYSKEAGHRLERWHHVKLKKGAKWKMTSEHIRGGGRKKNRKRERGGLKSGNMEHVLYFSSLHPRYCPSAWPLWQMTDDGY